MSIYTLVLLISNSIEKVNLKSVVMFKIISSTAFLVASVTNQYAQGTTWQKLTTEAYPGKQDDITFVDKNTGW